MTPFFLYDVQNFCLIYPQWVTKIYLTYEGYFEAQGWENWMYNFFGNLFKKLFKSTLNIRFL